MMNSISLEFYECLICSEIVLDNRECKSCHKLFCFECIHKWLKSHNNCPHCNRAPVQCKDKNDFDSFIHNYHAELIANSVEVECPNIDECDVKKIPRGDLKKHLDQFCSGRKCACKMAKYGCTWFGLSRNLDEHLAHECAFSNPIIAKALEELEIKVSSLTTENQKIKEENMKLTDRIKELEERRVIQATAPSENQMMGASQFNHVMQPVYSSPSTLQPNPMSSQRIMSPSFNQSPQTMNQSMYNSVIYPSYTPSYPLVSTSLQSPTYGSMPGSLKRVRMTITTCIWNRLPNIRGDAYLPLTDGYSNDFEFNVNEQNNGEITSYGNPQVCISGNWMSGVIQLNMTWPQLNRNIVVDGMAGFCTTGVINLTLNFAVKSTGLAGRGNVGDGGRIHCTLVVN